MEKKKRRRTLKLLDFQGQKKKGTCLERRNETAESRRCCDFLRFSSFSFLLFLLRHLTNEAERKREEKERKEKSGRAEREQVPSA